ncbi:MAG: helix-turn-helix domain-containing protein [Fibrobacter sp.]|uniref:helix-turn-helix domain-containing protein n=1 Tax=Fibrobacter sp. UWH1 TaxID=1964354 RepID=UPI000B523D3F|nr:helix-turn-helix domain-containing protein [Fibrobacter sp. UWH1]MCQ2103794.1 helix-turn-helix domain-containing protein [Fibrobacter sp.]OWV07328.1 hypothetical protein B7992_14385 [Fibrobacter sp. UWH1]
MTADELLTKTDLEKAVSTLKNELLDSISAMIGGGTATGSRVLNVKQAAEYLKCAEDTVRKRAQRGEIAYSKDGRDLKFYISDLDEYLRSKRIMSVDEASQKASLLRHFR